MEKTNQKHDQLVINMPWELVLRNKEVQREELVDALGKHRKGVFLIGKTDTVEFITQEHLRELAAEDGNVFYKSANAFLEIALAGKGLATFNVAEDAVIVIKPGSQIFEKVQGKREEVKAWWARPGGRAVKLINLSQPAEIVYAQVVL